MQDRNDRRATGEPRTRGGGAADDERQRPHAAHARRDGRFGASYDAGRVLMRPRSPGDSTERTSGHASAAAAQAARISERFRVDARFADVRVTVIDGVAELEGCVADEAARRTAAEIAAGVGGIDRVDNRLRIAEPAPPGAD
jgi:hypothetical protein